MDRLIAAVLMSVVAALGMVADAQATFSGENGRIFYVAGAFTPSASIISVCPSGTHQKSVIDGGLEMSPSPDGSKIAYMGINTSNGNTTGIWIANADGTN